MEEKVNSRRTEFQMFARTNWIEDITILFKSSRAIVMLLMAFSLVSCSSIKQSDSIRYHPRCEIHGCRMEHTILTLDEYAGRKMPESFYAARGGIFPHTGTAFPVCAFYPNRDMTWRCPECVRAGKIWCDEHLKNQSFL